MSRAGLGRGVLMGLLGASLAAQAVPPPPTWAQRVAGADVILLGEVRQWKRTSWFWQSERVYEGSIHVERVLKGHLPEPDVALRVLVHPGEVGGELSNEPRTGRFAFFLVRAADGRLTLSTPQVYAFQALSPDELAALETALHAGDTGGRQVDEPSQKARP